MIGSRPLYMLFAIVLLPAPAEAANEEITYANQVSRIIQDNCQNCHQPGGIGPMSLTSYDEVRPWAPLIRLKVLEREMPPFQYDHDVGIQELKNDWRLSDGDINTIVAWVDTGSPIGDPENLPSPKSYPAIGEWRLADELGPPDHIIRSSPWDVPAEGQDLWWRPEVATGITESRCIKAIESLPSKAANGSTHHLDSEFLVQNESGEWVSFSRLSEYAQGKLGERVPEDTCRRAPANSRLLFSIHYYPDGNAVPDDQVSVGIWYHDEADNFDESAVYTQDLQFYTLDAGDDDYLIPPHGKLMTQGYYAFDHPVRIDSWQPHLHLRGVAMAMEIFYPETGQRELVSQSSNWNAGWNHNYIYEQGFQPLIPAGASIILTGWYDNTAGNPLNPDPDQWVGGGQRTTDEMSHAWIAITHLTDEGYEEMLLERNSHDQNSVATSGDVQ